MNMIVYVLTPGILSGTSIRMEIIRMSIKANTRFFLVEKMVSLPGLAIIRHLLAAISATLIQAE